MVCSGPPALFGSPDGNAQYSGDAALAAAVAAQASANTALTNAATAEADAQSALALIATLTTTVNNGPSMLRHLGTWVPNNAAAGLLSIGNVPGNGVGTAALSRPANTSLLTSRMAVKYTGTSGTNRGAGIYGGAGGGVVFRGDTAGHGGFRMHCTIGFGSSVANSSAFFGLFNPTTSQTDGNANIQPTNFLNCFGIGLITGSSNLDVISNDGSGSATAAANLGASFPGNDALSVYQIFLYAPPNDASCYYTVIRENDGSTVSNSIGTNLPTATTTLYPTLQFNTAGTSGQTVLYIYNCTFEAYSW